MTSTPARWRGLEPVAAGCHGCRRADRASRTSARRRTRGRCSRSMRSEVWCSCRPATCRSICTAAIAAGSRTAATTTRARSLRWKRQPVVSLAFPDRAPRPLGLRRRHSRCCSTGRRTRHGAGARAADEAGHLYVDRVTGEPLVPVEERPVPQDGAVPGEYLSPTQPFPANDAFIVRKPTLTEADMWGSHRGPRQVPRAVSRGAQRRALHAAVVAGHAHLPNNMGVANWGSVSIDARQHESRRDDHDHGAACRGAGTHGARRVSAAAGRDAVRVLVEAIAVTVGRAVQPATVGNADGDRPQEPQACSKCRRHDARPRAVSDLAQARHAEHRRPRHDGVGADVHRRDDRQLPACVRECTGEELWKAATCGPQATPMTSTA